MEGVLTVQKLLRRKDVQSLTGLATSTMYEMIARGLFPKPINLSKRAVAWLESEVAQWQAERIAERDADTSKLGMRVSSESVPSGSGRRIECEVTARTVD